MNSQKSFFILAIIGFITFVGCKPGNQASTNSEANHSKKSKATETVETTNPDAPGTSRLIVSFISIGEGADFSAKDSMDTYIAAYQTESKKQLTFESVPWGREGEFDYCFTLKELSAKEQVKFIEGLRAHLKFSELVQISENQPCKQRR